MGYKAFLVGVDREACALYKKALDKYLPAEYSEVVYTSAHNDDAHLKEYYISSDDEKAVRKDFAKLEKLPKILIVTEKLLTGYDAPVLYAMYLDKPMRDHALLQAVARVNRPYENEDKNMKKPHGFILDFIGIFDKLKSALAFDSKDVTAVVKHIDLLKKQFAEKITKDAVKYLKLAGTPITDKDIDNLIEHFRDKSKRKEFFKLFKEVEALYEIISPDAFMRPYIKDYSHLSEIYYKVRNAFAKRVTVDREFLRKTNKLVRDYVSGDNIQGGFDFFEINEEGLKRIQDKNKPGNVKVINLIKSIQKYVEDNSGDLSLIPLAMRAQAVKEKYDERQEATKDALQELISIVENEVKAQDEKKAKGFDGLAAFIYSTVLDKKLPDADKTARKIRATFDQYTYWQGSESVARELRLALYGVVGEVEKDDDKVSEFIHNLFDLLEKSKDI
jgi:type I restriction enzyme R subunit